VQGAYANNLSWQHAGDALLANVLGGIIISWAIVGRHRVYPAAGLS
jgi:hypothetical protein